MMTFDDLQRAMSLHNENNDCTVKALAVCRGIPYTEARKICRSYGRRDRDGMRGYQVLRMLSDEFGAERMLYPEMQRLRESIGVSNLTANNITKALKRCGYGDAHVYAMTCDHAIGIRKCEVIDWTAGKRNVIKSLVIVPPAQAEQAAQAFRKLRHRKAKRLGLDPKTGQPLSN